MPIRIFQLIERSVPSLWNPFRKVETDGQRGARAVLRGVLPVPLPPVGEVRVLQGTVVCRIRIDFFRIRLFM